MLNTRRCNKQILMSPMVAVIRKAGTDDSPEFRDLTKDVTDTDIPTLFICLD